MQYLIVIILAIAYTYTIPKSYTNIQDIALHTNMYK
ncbi:hypothetical protein NIES23_38430 [Trichormus variabilis NIES-23]|uniref:Uncharacterized protein n=1 Tax=Trichormus variabilis NIES-23 TaxID=1973479 RepID=A0A1Z4KPY8_ANAVA|nr:hypothetical protein NIES23_38430 [Trichormus variabilis NIES-23]